MGNGTSWYQVRAAAGGRDVAEILLYDRIGEYDVSAADFARSLQAVTAPTIRLRINSPGGSVWDGTAVYNSLKNHPARVITEVEGLAASIASLIALAGDEVRMAGNAFMMIHNASVIAVGGKNDMRDAADLLDTIDDTLARTYASKSGRPLAEIKALMDAETWLTADEAKALGLVDAVTNPLKVAASYDPSSLSAYRKAPAAVRAGAGAVAVADRLVAERVARGQQPREALLNVFREDQELHNRWLSEKNGREIRREIRREIPGRPAAPAAAGPGADPVVGFDQAVRAEMAGGKSRAQAIRAVAIGNPTLHREYLVAATQQARAAQRAGRR